MEWFVEQSPNPRCVDLFCGAGGLSTGFQHAGFDVIAGVDANAQAVETWRHNHTHGKGIVADLQNNSAPDILREEGIDIDRVDVVVGGPPCQDFSKCNQKLDLDRNNLVRLFAEYVAEIQPTAFLIENVRQLTSTYKEVYNAVVERLESVGYKMNYRLLDAADYGVPQHRVRTFILGIRNADSIPRHPEPTHGPDSRSGRSLVSSGEALEDIPKPPDASQYAVTSSDAHLLGDIPPGMNYQFYTERMGHPDPEFEWRSRFSDYLYKADPDRPVRTLKAQPGSASGPFHWDCRRFTERELQRLQGFPDTYVFPHGYTATVKQIGNSVPPPIARSLGIALRQQMNPRVGLLLPDEELNFRSRKRVSSDEYARRARTRLEEIYSDGELDFNGQQRTLDQFD